MIIAGATGKHDYQVNGTYKPTNEVYNDRVLFRKEGDSGKWLRYTDEGIWVVSSTASKNTNAAGNRGWAHCVEKGLHDPAEAGTWKVLDYGGFASATPLFCPPVTCVRFEDRKGGNSWNGKISHRRINELAELKGGKGGKRGGREEPLVKRPELREQLSGEGKDLFNGVEDKVRHHHASGSFGVCVCM